MSEALTLCNFLPLLLLMVVILFRCRSLCCICACFFHPLLGQTDKHTYLHTDCLTVRFVYGQNFAMPFFWLKYFFDQQMLGSPLFCDRAYLCYTPFRASKLPCVDWDMLYQCPRHHRSHKRSINVSKCMFFTLFPRYPTWARLSYHTLHMCKDTYKLRTNQRKLLVWEHNNRWLRLMLGMS